MSPTINYIRVKRSPEPKSDFTSKVMSKIEAKNTEPEILVRRGLREHGFTGYRLHYKNAPGKPDIVFVNKKIAIFVHGCFWHRCPKCSLKLPKHNSKFWLSKFEANVLRDKRKLNELRKAGWYIFTLWECDIKINVNKQIKRIINKLGDE